MNKTFPVQAFIYLLVMIGQPSWAQMIYDADSRGPVTVLDESAGPYDLENAKVIGEIPGGTLGLRPIGDTFQLEDGTKYIAVRFEGQNGWVDADRLVRRRQENWEVERLHCSGTEPFWGLQIAGNKARFRINEQEVTLSRTVLKHGANRRDIRETRWKVGVNEWVIFFLDRPSCDDGMSDFNYPVEVLVGGWETGDHWGPLAGCCSFDPAD